MTVAQLIDALKNMPQDRCVEAEGVEDINTVFGVRLAEDYYDNVEPGDTPENESVVLITQPSWNGESVR